MKYELFARLNQGSMSLNSQEIRNCLYRGPYNRSISTLGTSITFLKLLGRKAPDKRMKHQELVLRFFALLHRRDRYRTPFRTFLNEEMEENRDADDALTREFRYEFESGLTWNERVFGNEVFRFFRMGSANRPPGRWSPRRYDLVYEVSMVGFAQLGNRLDEVWAGLSSSDQNHFRGELRHALVELMADEGWAGTISHSTTLPSVLNRRFDSWLQRLELTIDDPSLSIDRAERRRERLIGSPNCLHCQQPLTSDDAIWSAISNGNLVHYFCKSQEI